MSEILRNLLTVYHRQSFRVFVTNGVNGVQHTWEEPVEHDDFHTGLQIKTGKIANVLSYNV